MPANILDGRALARRLRERIAEETAKLRIEHRILPGLAAVLVGDDPASRIYVDNKHRACEAVGMYSRQIKLPSSTRPEQLDSTIEELNADPAIHGILVQLPLPPLLNPEHVQERLDPDKDVDGLHPVNGGRLLRGTPTFIPCTPYGVLEILRDAQVDLKGARVVIVGRSILVGRPLAVLLSLKGIDATVVQTHSRTVDLREECARADVLVVAVGIPRLVTSTWVKPGAVVIDVGVNRLPDGTLTGDVAFEDVSRVAGAITPVPGGVGQMTIAMLLQNTLEAARAQNGLPRRPLEAITTAHVP
ncbi:MAG: bifunctional methylenetetrahydrofolate dehydrogenase/methenyltetrahydrofolate cyclohydrolase FolD [Nitriliruptorales bacterium]